MSTLIISVRRQEITIKRSQKKQIKIYLKKKIDKILKWVYNIDRQTLIDKLKYISLELSVFYADKIEITISVNTKVNSAIVDIKAQDL